MTEFMMRKNDSTSCDGGKTWFQMGRGGAPPKDGVILGRGPAYELSHVDDEGISYYRKKDA